MVKYYIELGLTINTALFDDDYLVAYEEYKCNVNTLDILASRIADSHPGCVTVITHGLLYEKELEDSYVAYAVPVNGRRYYCNLNKVDVDTILHMLETLRVKNVRVVDKFGYYELLSSQDAIVVDKAMDLCLLYVKAGQERSLSYASGTELETALAQTMVNTGITNVVNASTEFIRENTQGIKGLDDVYPQSLKPVLAMVSLCSYCNSTLAPSYELKINTQDTTAAQSTDLDWLTQKGQDGQPAVDKDNTDSEIDDLLGYECDDLDIPSSEERDYYSVDGYAQDSSREVAAMEMDFVRQEQAGELSEQPDNEQEKLSEQPDTEQEKLSEQPEQAEEPDTDDFDKLDDDMFSEPEQDSDVESLEQDSTVGQTPEKVPKKGGLKMLLSCGVAAGLFLAGSFALYIQNDITSRSNIARGNEIADLKTSIESMQETLADGGSAVKADDSDVGVIQKIKDVPINGYVGEVIIDKDSYGVLTYLYKESDEEVIKQKFSEIGKVMKVEERWALDIDGKQLYKRMYVLERGN